MFTTVDWTGNVIKVKFIYRGHRIIFNGAGIMLSEIPTDDIKDSIDNLEKKLSINFLDSQTKLI